MQFGILFLGAMVFVFYQFVMPPLFFNSVERNHVQQSVYAGEYSKLENQYAELHKEKQVKIREMIQADKDHDNIKFNNAVRAVNESKMNELIIKDNAVKIIKKANPNADTNDTNFIFPSFVINVLPAGLIGLILAAIFSASMSSTSAALNALASTTVVDVYKRMIKTDATEKHYLIVSKLATVFWGIYAILFALFANRMGSLIEAVNILGSIFYGTILGIFLVAFYLKKVGGSATFYSAIIAEVVVIGCYLFTDIPYLWYNVIGCMLLVILAILINPFFKKQIIN
jgi:Na+(H+)/acetate symporter ActP